MSTQRILSFVLLSAVVGSSAIALSKRAQSDAEPVAASPNDACIITRSMFDAIPMGAPEYDMLPDGCKLGDVIREVNVGSDRRPFPIRVWRYARAGGGYITITTSGYHVSGKAWE